MRPVLHTLLLLALLLPATARAQQFARKECLDCHQKFADKYMGLKNVHAIVKQQKCEDCHLRHGIVPKLLLKESGNALCLKCHDKKAIGLDKPNVHPVLRTGECTQCHDAHGSNAKFMLKAEGDASCFSCHKKEPFERKVQHKAGNCATCHTAHASSQKKLLVADPIKLCIKCHSAEEKNFQAKHGGLPVATSSCTGCHDPHSADRPKLLRTSLHQPMKGGACAECHVEGKGFALKAQGGAGPAAGGARGRPAPAEH